MARIANTTVSKELPTVDVAAVASDATSLAQLSEKRTQIIAHLTEQFGVALPPFDADLYWSNVSFLGRQAGEIVMQQSVWLIALKSALPHGVFESQIKERCGYSPRTAQTLMQAATRLATDGGKVFLAKAQQAALLTKTRLIELAVNMPEADLETLGNDGEVAGYTREEYLCMSRAELLAALKRRDASLEEGAAQLDKAEQAAKAAKAARKRDDVADPDGERLKQYEHDMIDAASAAAKLLRVDMKALHDALCAHDWSDEFPLSGASTQRHAINVDCLRRIVDELRATAERWHMAPSEIGLAVANEDMPAEFE